jgi:hypothetical protein
MPRRNWSNVTDDELIAMIESLQRRETIGEIAFMTQPGGGQVQRSYAKTPDADKKLTELQYEAFSRGLPNHVNPYLGMVKRTLPSYQNG